MAFQSFFKNCWNILMASLFQKFLCHHYPSDHLFFLKCSWISSKVKGVQFLKITFMSVLFTSVSADAMFANCYPSFNKYTYHCNPLNLNLALNFDFSNSRSSALLEIVLKTSVILSANLLPIKPPVASAVFRTALLRQF